MKCALATGERRDAARVMMMVVVVVVVVSLDNMVSLAFRYILD